MARRKSPPATQEHQIPLIEVEHPMHKPFKAIKRRMDKNDDEQSSLRESQDENRVAMIDLFKEHKIEPDEDGVRRIEIDGQIIEIAPGESKLRFRNKPKPKVEEEDEADTDD